MFINLFALLAFNLVLGVGHSGAQPAGLLKVNLAEDEFILPPYLMRVEGGKLNVLSRGQKHSAEPLEWLDLDQEYDLTDRMALQVLLNENAQWVGGGVLKLKAAEREWVLPSSPYKLKLSRGVLAVWVNSKNLEKGIEVETQNEKFSAQNAQFWITSRVGVTELYVHSGTLIDRDGKTWSGKKYIRYENGQNGVSTAWNADAYKIKISGLYPYLVKLMDQAEQDWNKNQVAEVYAQARKNGWRKKLRK